MSDDTTITLSPKDAAVVIREDGSLQLVIPGHDADDLIPFDSSGWKAFLLSIAYETPAVMGGLDRHAKLLAADARKRMRTIQ